ARPGGFFKSKGIIFVDQHGSHIYDNVIKALNLERLEVLKILSGMTCILQPPDVSKEFTKRGNCKRVSYELISNWISEVWNNIDPNILVKSFEVTGLVLNFDSSENYKMSSHLQSIISNPDDATIEELSEDDILEESFQNMIEIDKDEIIEIDENEVTEINEDEIIEIDEDEITEIDDEVTEIDEEVIEIDENEVIKIDEDIEIDENEVIEIYEVNTSDNNEIIKIVANKEILKITEIISDKDILEVTEIITDDNNILALEAIKID
ncbi:13253_t:CDS:2, partial [Racocetra persica]